MNPSHVSSSKGKSNVSPEFAIEPDPQTIKLKSSPTSVEFHPDLDNILLVGTQDVETPGEIPVKKVTWSPSGSIFGIAFAEHFVHLYSQNVVDYFGFTFLKQIDAHDGAVTDISFSRCHPLSTMLLITCGDDCKINIWQAESGEHLYTFLQDSPVCSVCPFIKQDDYYLLSASNDGKIKRRRFRNRAEGVNIDLPFMEDDCKVHFDASSNRFFFSGIFHDKTHGLVEWDESKGCLKRRCKEMKSHCPAIISANGILAAGDEYQIKCWDMDNDELLTSTGVNEEFPECPTICFNRKGSLLVVGARDNKIKIFRITGQRKLRGIINYCYDPEISKQSQCQSLLLSDPSRYQIGSLSYNESGNRLFGMTSNNLLLTWTWPIGHTNLPGKAITTMQPKVNKLQLNVPKTVHEASLLVSYNQYVLCSVGDRTIKKVDINNGVDEGDFLVSNVNVASITIFPKEGIAAFGLVNGHILLWNIEDKQEKKVLDEGHTRPVTGLAVSERLKYLVSADDVGKIFVWNMRDWTKHNVRSCKIPDDRTKDSHGFKTHIGFIKDSMYLFVARSTHLAIVDSTRFSCVNKAVLDVSIIQATVSCDGNTIYAILKDNTVRMFDSSTLEPFCRIKSSVYNTNPLRLLSVTPVSIAASPSKPFQFAVGLTNGTVRVFEPCKKSEEEAIVT